MRRLLLAAALLSGCSHARPDGEPYRVRLRDGYRVSASQESRAGGVSVRLVERTGLRGEVLVTKTFLTPSAATAADLLDEELSMARSRQDNARDPYFADPAAAPGAKKLETRAELLPGGRHFFLTRESTGGASALTLLACGTTLVLLEKRVAARAWEPEDESEMKSLSCP